MTDLSVADVDLMEDTWSTAVPHEALTLLRREAPVHWHELMGEKAPGFWAITKYDDVRAISRDTATFSSEEMGTFIADPTPEALAVIRLTLLNMDPPKHNRYRRLVNRGFTPRMIRQLHDQIDERAVAIADAVRERARSEGNADGFTFDFVESVAMEMPAQVICDMLGVPDADRKMVVDWSNTMVGFDDPYWQNTPEAGELAAMQIYAYCDELSNERRKNPQDDILSVLLAADVDGEALTQDELNMFFVILVVAGNETTRNLISHSVQALIDHPESVDRLHADPGLWDSAVEEFLRWGTSIHNFRRTALVDTTVRGVDIKAGDKLVLYYASANYDEDVFADPFTFDIARTPNDHLTFGGGGEHFCLGANLARIEIKAMVREVVNRLPGLTNAGKPTRMRSDFINGINHLPLHLPV